MNISYCENWWFARKVLRGPIEMGVARCRHDKRQPYTALLHVAGQPRCVVEIADGWVCTSFLDSSLRQYLAYHFKEVAPGRLFLRTAYHWDFEPESDAPTVARTFSFHEDGRTLVVERNVATGERCERETTASVGENWEPYPAFGEYISLCREDRPKES